MKERRHLTSTEVEKILVATKEGRHAARDRCFVFLMFRHGLRVSEAVGLKLSQVDIDSGVIHVNRLKKGLPTIQPLRKEEIRAITAWLKERSSYEPLGDYFFCK